MKKGVCLRNHLLFALLPHGVLDKSLTDYENYLFQKRGNDPGNINISLRQMYIDIRRIDVVICVHNALEDVQLCLESIKNAKTSLDIHLILVDDASNKETAEYINNFMHENDAVDIIRNNSSLGYTRSANLGLVKAEADFIILLNSDTIVTDYWADKLVITAYLNESIGIVGPLSNAASHQSVPSSRNLINQTAVNILPQGTSIDMINAECESLSENAVFPYVPLIHGFCMGIKRNVIKRIGVFDEKNFPRGYGEENDFCLRASNAGYLLRISLDTYIYHAKSKSFTDSKTTDSIDESWKYKIGKNAW